MSDRKLQVEVNVDAFVEASKNIDPIQLATDVDREVRASEEEHRMRPEMANINMTI